MRGWQLLSAVPAALGCPGRLASRPALATFTRHLRSPPAASNCYLDALAHAWQGAGLPATAVDFGPFGDTGMAAALADSMEAVGLRSLQGADVAPAFQLSGAPASAAGCTFHSCCRPVPPFPPNACNPVWPARAGVLPQRVHARISVAKFVKVNTAKGGWSLVDDLTATSAPAAAAATATQAGGSRPAAAAVAPQPQPPAGPSPEELQGIVRGIATEILGEGQLEASGQFPAGGFDSLSAVELSNKIGQALGAELPGTLVFDYPSVGAICSFLATKLAPKAAAAGAAAPAHVTNLGPALLLGPGAAPAEAGVLIHLSLAARAPLAAWEGAGRGAQGGHDAISAVPFNRWDLEALRVGASLLHA